MEMRGTNTRLVTAFTRLYKHRKHTQYIHTDTGKFPEPPSRVSCFAPSDAAAISDANVVFPIDEAMETALASAIESLATRARIVPLADPANAAKYEANARPLLPGLDDPTKRISADIAPPSKTGPGFTSRSSETWPHRSGTASCPRGGHEAEPLPRSVRPRSTLRRRFR